MPHNIDLSNGLCFCEPVGSKSMRYFTTIFKIHSSVRVLWILNIHEKACVWGTPDKSPHFDFRSNYWISFQSSSEFFHVEKCQNHMAKAWQISCKTLQCWDSQSIHHVIWHASEQIIKSDRLWPKYIKLVAGSILVLLTGWWLELCYF